MSQRNQKIGERKSDLACGKCGAELKWQGGVLDGKMVCLSVSCQAPPPKIEYATLDRLEMDEWYGD